MSVTFLKSAQCRLHSTVVDHRKEYGNLNKKSAVPKKAGSIKLYFDLQQDRIDRSFNFGRWLHTNTSITFSHTKLLLGFGFVSDHCVPLVYTTERNKSLAILPYFKYYYCERTKKPRETSRAYRSTFTHSVDDSIVLWTIQSPAHSFNEHHLKAILLLLITQEAFLCLFRWKCTKKKCEQKKIC